MKCGGVGTYGITSAPDCGLTVAFWLCSACGAGRMKFEDRRHDGVPLPESLVTSDSLADDFALYETPDLAAWGRRCVDDGWQPPVMWAVENDGQSPIGDVVDAIRWLVRGAA
jgi:hypothetical protein